MNNINKPLECDDCGVAVYLKDWGQAGLVLTEIDSDQTHRKEHCLAKQLSVREGSK